MPSACRVRWVHSCATQLTTVSAPYTYTCTQLFSNEALLPMCMLATIVGCLPAMVHQIRMPTTKGLLLCMANCAFSFYMFGFQVRPLPCTAVARVTPACARTV